MEGKKVVVLANLKSRSLGGFPSHGMVMCVNSPTSNPDEPPAKIEILHPPADVPNGERVVYGDMEMLDADESLPTKPKNNPWITCAPFFVTNEKLEATTNGKVWNTSKGPVACKSISNGPIS